MDDTKVLEKLNTLTVKQLQDLLNENLTDVQREEIIKVILNKFAQGEKVEGSDGNTIDRGTMDAMLRNAIAGKQVSDKKRFLIPKVRDQIRNLLIKKGVSEEKIAQIENNIGAEPVVTTKVINSKIQEVVPEMTETVNFDEAIIKPEPQVAQTSTKTPRIIINPESKAPKEKAKKEPPKAVFGPEGFVGVEQNLEHIQDTKKADEYIGKKLQQSGVNVPYVRLGEKAAGPAKEFIAGIFGQIRGGKIEPNETTQPKNFAQQVTGFFKKSPQEQVEQMIETKREIAAHEVESAIVKPEVQIPTSPQRMEGNVPRVAPPAPVGGPERLVRQHEHVGGPVVATARFVNNIRQLPRSFLGRAWSMIRGGQTAGQVARLAQGAMAATGAKAVTTTAVKGLFSKIIIGVGSKLGGPVSMAIFWGAQKIIGGLKGVSRGLFGSDKPAYVLAFLVSVILPNIMTIGFALGTIAGTLVFLAVVIPMGMSLVTTTAITGSFVQFPENNSKVAAGLPAPAVSITKNSKLNLDGSISYSVNIKELKPVSNPTVTDVVKIIDKNGTRTLPSRSFSYSPSISYTLPNPGVTDAIIVNTVTVAGVSASSQTIIGNPPITVFSCPVVGGTISLGSFDKGGHCGPNYSLKDACPGGINPWPGNEMAIDVPGSVGQSVYLPVIDGKSVAWQLVREGNDLNYTFNGATQKFREFKAVGVDYVIQIHHLTDDNLLAGKTTLNSGDVLGKLAGFDGNVSSPHAHIQIQRAGVWTAADDPTLKFCQ